MRERQLQARDTQAPGGEPRREFLHHAVDAEPERFGVVHGRGQLEPARKARRRHERWTGIGDAAEHAVECCQEIGAAAACESVARQRRRLRRTS